MTHAEEPRSGRAARGLGRGLESLIPPRLPTRDGDPREVPLGSIRPNPNQPRSKIDPATLEELAASIREHGILQPVVVTPLKDDTYQLIAGERRWRAARLAGLERLPVVVKDATTPRASLEMALVENVQRRDLNALEEALAYRQLVQEHGLTPSVVAERVGKSRVAVANTLRLLQLPRPVQQALADGAVTEGHARAILGAPTEATQLALLKRVVAQGLNVRQTEALARAVGEESPPVDSPGAADPDLARMEESFRQALGTRVQLVRRPGGGGRLVVHFYSDDELDGLYQRVAGSP